MLPDVLLDSYKQYKSDTAQLATWLAETARACGCTSESINQPTCKPPRLKGRARTEAKKNTRGSSISFHEPTTTTTAKHPLALKEFSTFAKAIATFETPPVRVPPTILRIGKYAISARKRCAKWFSMQADNGSALEEQHNRAHMHVVDVLEEVLDLLQSRCVLDDGTRKDQVEVDRHKENSSDKVLKNRFEYLDIEGVLEEDVDIRQQRGNDAVKPMGPVSGSTQTQHQPQTRYQMESSEGDTQFAIFCLLEDLGHMRKYICQIWQDYSSGTLDLISASVTTNTAIELIRRAEEDFVTVFPELSTYELILNVYFPSVKERHNLHPDREDDEQYEIFDSIFFTPFRFLADFCDAVNGPPGQKYMPNPVWGRIYDPRSHRGTMSAVLKLREDVILMSEVLPEFLIMFMGNMIPTADEVSVGLRTMFCTSSIKLWVLFAFQIFIDIHHALREEVSRGCLELRSFGLRAHSTLQEFLNSSFKDCENIWPNRRLLVGVQNMIEDWILNDALLKRREAIFGAKRDRECGPGKPYGLLSQHPLACGLLMFAISLGMHRGGLNLANTLGWTQDAAHLYNAAQQEGLLTVPWVDMDHLIKFESTERVFVGQAPTNPQAYHKHYSLVEGVSVESFARNRRKKANVISKRGPRGFDESSAVSNLFHRRYCNSADEVDITVEHVEALLAQRARMQGNHFSSTSSIHKRWGLSHKLSSLQLVAVLKDCIVMDAPRFRFDHFAMHQRCWELLVAIQASLRDDTGEQYGRADMHKVAVQLELLTRMLLEERADPESELGVIWLSRTGEVMQSFLEGGGDTKGKISGVVPETVEKVANSERSPPYPLTHVGYSRADFAGTKWELLIPKPEKNPATLWGILHSETDDEFNNNY